MNTSRRQSSQRPNDKTIKYVEINEVEKTTIAFIAAFLLYVNNDFIVCAVCTMQNIGTSQIEQSCQS